MNKIDKKNIIFIIFAIAYPIEIIGKYIVAMYKIQYDIINSTINIGISIVILFSFWSYVNRNTKDKISKYIAYIFAIEATIDTVLNDALIGILIMGILFFLLILDNNEKKKIARLFFASAVTTEILSILLLSNVIENKSMMATFVESIVVDIVLILSVIFLCLTDKDKVEQVRNKKYVYMVITVLFELMCILSILYASYSRNKEFALSVSMVENGTKTIFLDAHNPSLVLTANENNLSLEKYSGSANQVFTLVDAEDEGKINIVSDNGYVFDVAGCLFEDQNPVQMWNSNNQMQQEWRIEEVDNAGVRIVSYYDDYILSTDNGNAIITNDISDMNQLFYMRNVGLGHKQFVGWIAFNHEIKVELMYAVTMFGLFIFTIVKIREEIKNETNNSNTML